MIAEGYRGVALSAILLQTRHNYFTSTFPSARFNLSL